MSIWSNLNEIRMKFDCESKKAMGIADGKYELRTNMADYRLDTDDFFLMQWATEYPVIVKNGEFDIPSVLKASQHLMDAVDITVFMLNNLIIITKVIIWS